MSIDEDLTVTARNDAGGDRAGRVQRMILASPTDESARWAWSGLRRRLGDVHLVTIDSLVYSTSITHRVGTGGVATEIITHDGLVIGPDLEVTWNRVEVLPLRHLDRAPEVERTYATQELWAIFTSILHRLPGRTINRAVARGLSGPALAPAEWAIAAGRAGLPVRPRRHPPPPDGTDVNTLGAVMVYVVGDAVLGDDSRGLLPIPPEIVAGARRLAATQRVEILGLSFELCDRRGSEGRAVEAAIEWEFAGAVCVPDLRCGGEPVVDALAALFERPAR